MSSNATGNSRRKPARKRLVPSPLAATSSNKDSLAARAQKLEAELLRLYGDLLAQKKATGAIQNTPERHSLRLSLELTGGEEPQAAPPHVLEQMQQAAKSLADRQATFPRGHVYCHWCRSFTCNHSQPPSPRSVFAGYTQTGEPSWRDLAVVLLDKRDERIDQLYREPPIPVTLVQNAPELTENQLQVYGKGSAEYRLLGQVVIGYLPLFGQRRGNGVRHGNGESTSVALTLHAVQHRSRQAAPVLNVLGALPDGASAVEMLESHGDPRIVDALATTRRKLQDLTLQQTPRRRRLMVHRRKALLILQRFARNLERLFRQRQRRTLHSESRHRDRRRPAATALRDAMCAASGSIYRDVEEKTWVVIGPKNRVHIFNDEAHHVTSVVYQGDTIRQRTTRGKWLTPKPVELAGFQEALRTLSD